MERNLRKAEIASKINSLRARISSSRRSSFKPTEETKIHTRLPLRNHSNISNEKQDGTQIEIARLQKKIITDHEVLFI